MTSANLENDNENQMDDDDIIGLYHLEMLNGTRALISDRGRAIIAVGQTSKGAMAWHFQRLRWMEVICIAKSAKFQFGASLWHNAVCGVGRGSEQRQQDSNMLYNVA